MCDNQPNAFQHIAAMLEGLNGAKPCMPPTSLYGEGWMLRLILQAAGAGYLEEFIPRRDGKLNWFSEAKLYTPFKGKRADHGEGFTNVDGIVGDFQWNEKTQTGVKLSEYPKRFEVFEAKMFSQLSKGVEAAPEYDQAVRTVACMAQTLAMKKITPEDVPTISFRVIAPQTQIDAQVFKSELNQDSMRKKVKKRIDQFKSSRRNELTNWHDSYFEPLLQVLEQNHIYDCISWESLIEAISDENRQAAIKQFYIQCCLKAGKQSPYPDEVT